MATPLINGRSYDFTQIIVTILGVPVASVSKITYNQKQEKTKKLEYFFSGPGSLFSSHFL